MERRIRSKFAAFILLLSVSGLVLAIPGSEIELPLSSPRFAEPSYTIGWLYDPQSLVLADFDGDSNPDIAVFDSNSRQLFVQGVNAEGLLTQHGNQIQMEPDARGMAAADLDGDGLADIVVANGISQKVNVYFAQPGNSIGWANFTTGAGYFVGAAPEAVTLADVNGDGHPDIVTANAGDASVSVLLNKGDGTFGPARKFKTIVDPIHVALADLDGDGHLDIVTVDQSGNAVSVLMGKGDGTFSPHKEYATGLMPAGLAIGDLDGDGKPDIVVANTTDGTVSLLAGVGDGTFKPKTDLTTAAGPISIGLADSTGAGALHSVITASQDGTISVLVGDGHGAFAGHVDYKMGDPVNTMAVADMNGDGLSDVVVASVGGINMNGNKTSIVYANDDGTLQAGKSVALPDLAIGLASGDFDHDGNLDVVVGVPNLGVTQLWFGQGDGTFVHKGDLTVTTGIQSIAVQDLNHDGIPDIAIAGGGNSVTVFIGNGDGTFTASSQNPLTSGNGPYKVVVADVNGDTFPDILTANMTDQTVSVFLGNGDGTFASKQDYAVGGPASDLKVGDVDGDHKQDIVTANYTAASFSLLRGNGDGTFKPHLDYATDSNIAYGVAIGDLNEDGTLDVAVSNNGTNVFGIYLGKGNGTFAAPVYYEANNGAGPADILMQDVDGDGHLDIVCSVEASDFVTILYGAGDGTFSKEADAATGPLPQALSLGDFNNDGTTDIAVAELSGNSFRIIPAIYMPPVVESQSLRVTAEQTYRGALQATTLSLDKNSITFKSISNPGHGTLSLNPDGSFAYTPAHGFKGSDSFTFEADAHMHSGKATVTIDVVPSTSGGSGGSSSSGGGGAFGGLSLLLSLLGILGRRRAANSH